MAKREDGGPAFPRPCSEDRSSGDMPDGNAVVAGQPGMTLLDWLAGQALVGLLAFSPRDCPTQFTPEEAAERAVKVARATLAELAK